jgi:hypothetical protein
MGVALVLSAASAASAQQSAAQGRAVQGVWYVQVTIRDCATGVALAPAVNSLVTFAAGGTLHESVGGGGFQHTVTVIDADHIESAGTNSFYRLNGDVYRTGCSTATGTRFE